MRLACAGRTPVTVPLHSELDRGALRSSWLCDADKYASLICMRTTLDLDDKLLEEAQRATGTKGKTAVIERGLRALVEQAARRRLAALRGKVPGAAAPRRRRARRA